VYGFFLNRGFFDLALLDSVSGSLFFFFVASFERLEKWALWATPRGTSRFFSLPVDTHQINISANVFGPDGLPAFLRGLSESFPRSGLADFPYFRLSSSSTRRGRLFRLFCSGVPNLLPLLYPRSCPYISFNVDLDFEVSFSLNDPFRLFFCRRPGDLLRVPEHWLFLHQLSPTEDLISQFLVQSRSLVDVTP